MKRLLVISLAALASLMSISASAETECPVKIYKVFSGDNGRVWLFYKAGGSAYLLADDPDLKSTLSLATSAAVAGNEVIIRYQADGVACTSEGRNDLVGFFLVAK